MRLSIPAAVLAKTSHADLENARENAARWNRRDESATVDALKLRDAALKDLLKAAAEQNDKRFIVSVSAILEARQGHDPNVGAVDNAAPAVLEYLRHDMIDGWVYTRSASGGFLARLLTGIDVYEHDNGSKELRLRLTAMDPTAKRNAQDTITVTVPASQVSRKRASAVLTTAGLMKETAALKADYEAQIEGYIPLLTGGFAKQYVFTGTPFGSNSWRAVKRKYVNAKVIHDVRHDEIASWDGYHRSPLRTDEDCPVPVLPTINVFDLGDHTAYSVNAADLTEYKYDTTLGQKLILPRSHRRLLDILTTDLRAYTSDIIEGKSAGNVILAQGIPGVGKTLTAEVYSEMILRPLYKVHSGTLGTTAESVEKSLKEVFARAERWECVTLIDEADVFVMARGGNLQQNAIVAEFLRTLEYFSDLLFLTTNRAGEVDDAIISRCIAVLVYEAPGRDEARALWKVMAATNKITLPDDLIDQLLDVFPTLTGRDIKNLLSLALRVAASEGNKAPTLGTFTEVAMFRGVEINEEAIPA